MDANHTTKDRELFNRINEKYCSKDLADSSRIARKQRLLGTLGVIPHTTANSVLEVGCGAGFSADYLKNRYDRFVGVDYADQLIQYAVAHHQRPGVEFHACDIREFKLEEPCDIVLMIGVLHHFDDIPEIMSHIVSMVKPGGWIVANEPQSGNPVVEISRRVRKLVDNGYSDDQVTLNADELRTIYRDAGLDNIRVVPQGYTSTPFAEVVLPPQIVTRMISRAACGFDRLVESSSSGKWLESLSWNLIAAGQRT